MSEYTTTDPRVVVLVCCYNGRQHLEDCLGSLRKHLPADGSAAVLLVDNASTDGSGAYAREHFPEVEVLRIEPNQGFAGGNNRGWEHIQSRWPGTEFVCLLNADTEVGPVWLGPLVTFMDEHPKCGAAQPKIMLQAQPSTINTVGNRSHYLGFGMMTGYGETDRGQYDEPRQWAFPSGCAVMLRAEALREVGLFDERFFMMLEDADLGWKLRLAGWEVWSQPASVIFHKYVPNAPLNVYEHLERNRWVMLLTYLPWRRLLLLSPMLLLMELGQALFALRHGKLGARLRVWRQLATGELGRQARQRREALGQWSGSDAVLRGPWATELHLPAGDPWLLRRIANPLLSLFRPSLGQEADGRLENARRHEPIETGQGVASDLRGRAVSSAAAYTLMSELVPLVVAVLAIPVLISQLGLDRFGLLTIAWMLTGQVALLDLGLSRALTVLLARACGRSAPIAARAAIWTGGTVLVLWSLVLTVGVAALTPVFVSAMGGLTAELRHEATQAALLLSLSIPGLILSAGARGVCEAYMRFGLMNLIRLGVGVFMFLGPVAVAISSPSLVWISLVLVVGRYVAMLILLAAARRAVPVSHRRPLLSRRFTKRLLRFGGWMTVSHAMTPLLVYVDRFAIAGLLGVGAVAFYTTPFDVAMRLSVFPAAVVAGLLPVLSGVAKGDREQTDHWVRSGVAWSLVITFPLVVLVVAWSGLGLRLWLGEAFEQASTQVLVWLSAAMFVNALAYVPHTLLQALERPRAIALLHAAEVPGYLILLAAMMAWLGVTGVAIAWFVRVAADAAALLILASRALPEAKRGLCQMGMLTLAGVGALAVLALSPDRVVVRGGLTVTILVAFAALCRPMLGRGLRVVLALEAR